MRKIKDVKGKDGNTLYTEYAGTADEIEELIESQIDAPVVTKDKWGRFEKELSTLINKNSMENYFNMPDFIIAENIVCYLKNLSEAIDKNKKWHGGI